MKRFFPRAIVALAAMGAAAGCHSDMRDQPRYETLEASEYFPNGQSARPLPPGTIARGSLSGDTTLLTGKAGDEFVERLPLEVDAALLARGQERFNIFCAPCHGRTGAGNGMIVQRGFRRPPSYHSERLRSAPDGHFFDVITHGFGAMPRYAPQIDPRDRWAIVAYIRALQLSQNAALDDVPPAERRSLEEESP
jgi:mono/diheme cytochrome c family protein